MRRDLVSELEHCQSEFRNDGIRLSDGDDPAERASQSDLTGTINHIARRIKEVDAALDRLAAGCYGACGDCGKPISHARLKANPTAQRCLKCQVATERRHR